MLTYCGHACRCGHCKRLTPEYEKAAGDLWDHTPQIKLGKVSPSPSILSMPVVLTSSQINAIDNHELSSSLGIEGYPALFVYRKGKRFPFDGERTREGIVEEMQALTKPAATVRLAYLAHVIIMS